MESYATQSGNGYSCAEIEDQRWYSWQVTDDLFHGYTIKNKLRNNNIK